MPSFALTIPKPADARPEWRPPLHEWREHADRMRMDLLGELTEAGLDVEVTFSRRPRNDGRGSEVLVEGEGVTAAMLAAWVGDRFMSGEEIKEIAHKAGLVAARVSSSAARVILGALGLGAVGAAVGGLVDTIADTADGLHDGGALTEEAGVAVADRVQALREALEALHDEASDEAIDDAAAVLAVPADVRARLAARLR